MTKYVIDCSTRQCLQADSASFSFRPDTSASFPQAVTLGAKRFPTDANGALIKGVARHPNVQDDVVIYAGATVLGRITIGAGSTIGGNVWLTESVAPGSNVNQAQMRRD